MRGANFRTEHDTLSMYGSNSFNDHNFYSGEWLLGRIQKLMYFQQVTHIKSIKHLYLS